MPDTQASVLVLLGKHGFQSFHTKNVSQIHFPFG